MSLELDEYSKMFIVGCICLIVLTGLSIWNNNLIDECKANPKTNYEPALSSLGFGGCVDASEYGCSLYGDYEICEKPRKEACESGSQEWFCKLEESE